MSAIVGGSEFDSIASSTGTRSRESSKMRIWRLLQEAGEAAVFEDAAAGLLCGAVVGLVLGEEDRLDRGAAAGTGFAFALVDLEGHRQLLGKLLSDRLLVVVDRVA